MRTLSIVAALVVALWAVGRGWTALGAGALAAAALYGVVFAAAFLYLGFWMYAADRAAGKVRRRIGLYERWLSHRESTK